MIKKILPIQQQLRSRTNPSKAKVLQGFFKTGPGQYGAGDVFLGLTVPQCRVVALAYQGLSFKDLTQLLQSKFHEERLVALLILVHHFQHGDKAAQEHIYRFYLEHISCINNWDLVDLSADKIVGGYLLHHHRGILMKLARSHDVWQRRIAMVATFMFIKHGQSKDALMIAKALLHDTHDLIHKAVGWMLREVGKRVSIDDERNFLDQHAPVMPRTMLRYAIERLPAKERSAYLAMGQ